MVDGAAQNPPEHIRAPGVARQYPVGNQKGHCPAMVGHGVVGGVLGAVIFVITPTQGFDTVNQVRVILQLNESVIAKNQSVWLVTCC